MWLRRSQIRNSLSSSNACIYKCELHGIAFVEADQWFPSSKLCNNCGTLKKDLKRSDRVYHCTCGHHCDRDLNASYNLRDYQAV
ncbi:MAG: transposase [Trichococcus flocculiformis]